MIYSAENYGEIPKVETSYLLVIGRYWYVGHTVNLYNRAKYRKSRLLHGVCNESRIQEAFDRLGKLPSYELLSRRYSERQHFIRELKERGAARCLNCLLGGDNISSHGTASQAVYKKISLSLKAKYKSDAEFRNSVRLAVLKSAKLRKRDRVV